MSEHADEARGRTGDGGDPSTAGGAHAGSTRTETDPGRHERERSAGRKLFDFIREIVIVVVLALVLSSLVKTFLVQPFWIPSDSMNDTLIRDDRVVVSKLTPGPFALSRGDIVVFEDPGKWLIGLPQLPKDDGVGQKIKDGLAWVGVLPSQEDNHLIKRVIGLPGDHVKCCDAAGRLEVNGKGIDEPYVYPGDKPSTIPFDIHVPDGKVWVMGDHRSNSRDSRYNDSNPDLVGMPALPGDTPEPGADPKDHTGYYGSVPIDKVVGKAVAIVWPLGRATGLGGGGAAFSDVPAGSVQSRARGLAGTVAAGTP